MLHTLVASRVYCTFFSFAASSFIGRGRVSSQLQYISLVHMPYSFEQLIVQGEKKTNEF